MSRVEGQLAEAPAATRVADVAIVGAGYVGLSLARVLADATGVKGRDSEKVWRR
jgi:hypothetical protein